jgi:hypothetical protein
LDRQTSLLENVADSTLAKWATGAPVACLPSPQAEGRNSCLLQN